MHTLTSAEEPKDVVQFLQEKTKPEKEHNPESPDDREPFEVLVDTLSGVVKWHLDDRGYRTITRDYVEKLDTTLSYGAPIDLRSMDEKDYISGWKKKHEKKVTIENNSEKSEEKHGEKHGEKLYNKKEH